MKGSIAHVLCPSMNFSAHGFCASLCFCKASDQHYRWPRGSRWSVDAVWITELSAESTVLPTSTLTHLLDFRSRGISGMDEIGDLCFVILYSHDFGVDCYSVGFSCAENFFFPLLPHTASSLSLLCRRDIPFHWTLDSFLCSWREAEERRTWITHNKERTSTVFIYFKIILILCSYSLFYLWYFKPSSRCCCILQMSSSWREKKSHGLDYNWTLLFVLCFCVLFFCPQTVCQPSY